MNVCLKCAQIHVPGDAVALSRFAGVTGFRTPDGAIHATRDDAQEWLCKQRTSDLEDRCANCGATAQHHEIVCSHCMYRWHTPPADPGPRYRCVECGGGISTADDLVTVNVNGHAKPAHRTCPTPPGQEPS